MCKEDDAVEPEIIKISHLSKSFGDVKAVNDLSFQVKKGELFAFLGENGAGKSTTILVNGLALILCYRHYRPSADDTGTAEGRGNHRQRRLRLFVRSLYANIQFWHWIAESIVLSAEHLRNFFIEESHAAWYY